MEVRALVRRLIEPRTVRGVTYGLATLGVLLSSYLASADDSALFVWPVVVASLLAAVALPHWRALVLATGAGMIAVVTTDETVYLWPMVAALTFGALAQDRSRVPWPGLAIPLVGATLSFAIYPVFAGPVSYVAVVVGAVGAILLRVGERNRELSVETTALRGQTAWLEQRTLLARELHDVVGHHVTAMVVQAEAGLVSDPERALSAIGDLGRTALGELDALVVHLRDPDAPISLSAPPRLSDVDELLAAPLRQQGVDVHVRIDPFLELDEVTTLTVYRIAQEALTNVARHARAASTWVELHRASHQLRLRVTDDGIGPPDEVTRGSGLVGIEERVHAAGGLWAISDRPGGGTVVDVFLPLSPVSRG